MADNPPPHLFLAAGFDRCVSVAKDDLFNIVLLGKDGKPFIISASVAVAARIGVRIAEQMKLIEAEGRTVQVHPTPERIVAEATPMPTDRGQMVALMVKGDRGTNLFGALKPDAAIQLAAKLSGAAMPPKRAN